MAGSMTGSSTSTAISTKEDKKISLKRAEGLVLILDTPKGRGVFANKDIPGRSVIEVCPVLVLDPVENEEHIKKTELYHYTYNWPYTPPTKSNVAIGATRIPSMTQAVILGLGSMFNHSVPNQNVGWERDVPKQSMTYTALRDIKAGEELCISYGQRLTFKDTEEKLYQQDPDDWTEVMNYIDFIG